jgi:hypothetical protein
MGLLDTVLAWLTAHSGTVATVAVVILELVMRLWPSNKIRSILSYAGKVCLGIGKVVFALADLLSKIVPDRPAPPK